VSTAAFRGAARSSDVRLRVLLVLVPGLLSVAVPLASGASRSAAVAERTSVPVQSSSVLWATINVCDTAAAPNTVGIRASMPGLARTAAMFMRFQVQYRDKDGSWRSIASDADSGWRLVGRVRRRPVESGQNFTFLPPASGGAHRLRGVVRFKWVRGETVVAKAKRVTTAGHRSTAGADPPGYNAAVCDIR
jgi:hypothetical protein